MNPSNGVVSAVHLTLTELEREAQVLGGCVELAPTKRTELRRIQGRIRELREQLDLTRR